jgi:hypothetical protein
MSEVAKKKIYSNHVSGVKEKDIPPAADSCPTPVFELGYRELNARLMLLSSRFYSQSLIYGKHPFKMDIPKSKECTRLGDECKRIADRVADWPNKSGSAVAGEKSWVAERYLDLISEAIELMDGEVF